MKDWILLAKAAGLDIPAQDAEMCIRDSFARGAGLLALIFYGRQVGSHARGLSPVCQAPGLLVVSLGQRRLTQLPRAFPDVSRRLSSVHPDVTATLSCPPMPAGPMKSRQTQLVNHESLFRRAIRVCPFHYHFHFRPLRCQVSLNQYFQYFASGADLFEFSRTIVY